MENTSGQGKSSVVPAEIDRWNWGAFLLNWIWGIGNNTFIALLMFVPFVNFIMAFVLGAKGSSWAWRNKRWDSVEHFRAVQRKWAMWGVGLLAASVIGFVALFFSIIAVIKDSEAFKLSLDRVEASQAAEELIGKPISTGMPKGSIQESGPDGSANLSFDVSGPKGKGTVFMEASRSMGQWTIGRLILEQEGTGERIDLGERIEPDEDESTEADE